MEMLSNILILAAGLAVLTLGGEALVQGAAKLARSMGISALVVGLTIVAFGTSAPELAVSAVACLQERDSLAVGNVVGSNIANLLLVFGLGATLTPMRISSNVVRVDGPIMLAATLLFSIFAYATWIVIGRAEIVLWHGIVLTVLLGVYITWTYRFSKSEPEAVQEEFAEAVRKGRSRILYVVLILIGLAGLKYGADLIVHGAVGIASTLGISERVIGLTIVAIGTSLPEIATSLVAVRRNQPDIAVGNVVGSNIFNILSVIGISAIIASPISIDASALSWDFPVMVVATLIVLPLMASGHRISRREGLVLLSMFVVYIGYTGLSG